MSGFKHEITILIDGSVIDEYGHVNNVSYVEWMQRGAMSHAASWQMKGFMKENQATWFARHHEIEYLRPVFEGEEITLRTWIATGERVKSLRKYEFHRNNQLIARG